MAHLKSLQSLLRGGEREEVDKATLYSFKKMGIYGTLED